MDTNSPSASKIELVVIKRNEFNEVEGKTLSEKEVNELLLKNGFNV